jgi:hypothetical protein
LVNIGINRDKNEIRITVESYVLKIDKHPTLLSSGPAETVHS